MMVNDAETNYRLMMTANKSQNHHKIDVSTATGNNLMIAANSVRTKIKTTNQSCGSSIKSHEKTIMSNPLNIDLCSLILITGTIMALPSWHGHGFPRIMAMTLGWFTKHFYLLAIASLMAWNPVPRNAPPATPWGCDDRCRELLQSAHPGVQGRAVLALPLSQQQLWRSQVVQLPTE